MNGSRAFKPIHGDHIIAFGKFRNGEPKRISLPFFLAFSVTQNQKENRMCDALIGEFKNTAKCKHRI